LKSKGLGCGVFRCGTKIKDICLSISFNSVCRGKKEKDKKEENGEMEVKGRKQGKDIIENEKGEKGKKDEKGG
jgi:hypothetical protein